MLAELITKNRNQTNWKWAALLLASVVLLAAVSAFGSAGAEAEAEGHGLAAVSPSLVEISRMENGLTLKIMVIMLQVAVVLAAAKLLGALAEKIAVPGVLGELAAGMVVGPFALGALLPVYVHGHWLPLFPAPQVVEGVSQWPISDELWLVSQLASVVLLFLAGLHTNLKQFLRYVGPATLSAIGGVVLPFVFGAWATAWFMGISWHDPKALFMGAIMVATSVGITARVLSDIKKLDTAEGVTILGGAVVDDVLGILVLAVVAAIARTGEVHVGQIVLIAVKAVGFWLGLTAVGFVLAEKIEALFERVRYAGARLGLALALALVCAGVAEIFGLAFIIGAYSIGLALSKTRMAHQLMEDLTPINDFIVPIFFAAMGMLVNFGAMGEAIGLGLVICILAVIGKIVGCGVPALAAGFNRIGAFRIGIGMLPRGEVALIMAGVGLAGGYIGSSLFGVAILMTLVTTIVAPLILVPAFARGGSGLRKKPAQAAPEKPEKTLSIDMPNGIGRAVIRVLLNVAAEKGYKLKLDESEKGIYLLQKDGQFATITFHENRLVIHSKGDVGQEMEQILAATEDNLIDACERLYPDDLAQTPQV